MSAGELLRKNKKKEMLFTEKKINSVPALASMSAGEREHWRAWALASVSIGERELASVSAGELLWKNKKKEMLFTEKKN